MTGSEFQTATSESCAAIYRLRETSHLSCNGCSMAFNLTQPEKQAMEVAAAGSCKRHGIGMCLQGRIGRIKHIERSIAFTYL